jgi:hypothetical protein
MDSALERIIIHYYPARALASPLADGNIRWDYDADNQVLKTILRELEEADLSVRAGTRSDYQIGEELVVGGRVRLQLSYLGPYAAIAHGPGAGPRMTDDATEDLVRTIEDVLAAQGVRVLSQDELDETVPWIRHGGPATVWQCLFALP